MKDIEQLKNQIKKNLIHEIDSDYCLIDIPNYYNIGDILIWQGELDFLKNIPHYKQKYSCSMHFFNRNKINKKDLILLQGGGNFGDLWGGHQDFREYILNHFPHNKIIIFPQTVYFHNNNNLTKSVNIFSNHKDVIICARDYKSFNFLNKYFTKNKIILIPDMAFWMSLNIIEKRDNTVRRVLFLKRTDRELKEEFDIPFIKNIEITDWPTYNSRYYEAIHLLTLQTNKIISKFINSLKLSSKNVLTDQYGFIQFNSKEKYAGMGIDFLHRYDLIITTRLHGHILATLLGIPNIILDNSYGKNKDFYNTWMKDNPLCYFAENKNELERIIQTYFPEVSR